MDMTKDMTADLAARNEKVATLVKELSRLKYGKDRELLEEEIGRRAKL
jgi:hypothetical protein